MANLSQSLDQAALTTMAERLVFEKYQLGVKGVCTLPYNAPTISNHAEVRVFLDFMTRNLVAELRSWAVAGKTHKHTSSLVKSTKTVNFSLDVPATWWEHLKLTLRESSSRFNFKLWSKLFGNINVKFITVNQSKDVDVEIANGVNITNVCPHLDTKFYDGLQHIEFLRAIPAPLF